MHFDRWKWKKARCSTATKRGMLHAWREVAGNAFFNLTPAPLKLRSSELQQAASQGSTTNTRHYFRLQDGRCVLVPTRAQTQFIVLVSGRPNACSQCCQCTLPIALLAVTTFSRFMEWGDWAQGVRARKTVGTRAHSVHPAASCWQTKRAGLDTISQGYRLASCIKLRSQLPSKPSPSCACKS